MNNIEDKYWIEALKHVVIFENSDSNDVLEHFKQGRLSKIQLSQYFEDWFSSDLLDFVQNIAYSLKKNTETQGLRELKIDLKTAQAIYKKGDSLINQELLKKFTQKELEGKMKPIKVSDVKVDLGKVYYCIKTSSVVATSQDYFSLSGVIKSKETCKAWLSLTELITLKDDPYWEEEGLEEVINNPKIDKFKPRVNFLDNVDTISVTNESYKPLIFLSEYLCEEFCETYEELIKKAKQLI
jgi:hypothetical protein